MSNEQRLRELIAKWREPVVREMFTSRDCADDLEAALAETESQGEPYLWIRNTETGAILPYCESDGPISRGWEVVKQPETPKETKS